MLKIATRILHENPYPVPGGSIAIFCGYVTPFDGENSNQTVGQALIRPAGDIIIRFATKTRLGKFRVKTEAMLPTLRMDVFDDTGRYGDVTRDQIGTALSDQQTIIVTCSKDAPATDSVVLKVSKNADPK